MKRGRRSGWERVDEEKRERRDWEEEEKMRGGR